MNPVALAAEFTLWLFNSIRTPLFGGNGVYGRIKRERMENREKECESDMSMLDSAIMYAKAADTQPDHAGDCHNEGAEEGYEAWRSRPDAEEEDMWLEEDEEEEEEEDMRWEEEDEEEEEEEDMWWEEEDEEEEEEEDMWWEEDDEEEEEEDDVWRQEEEDIWWQDEQNCCCGRWDDTEDDSWGWGCADDPGTMDYANTDWNSYDYSNNPEVTVSIFEML